MSKLPVDHNLPITLHLSQSLDLPLPGGSVKPGAPVWYAESKDPHIARVMLTSTELPQVEPGGAHPAIVWHLNIRGQKPGRTIINVRETAAAHPPKELYALALEVQILEQQQASSALLLSPDGRDNQLKIGDLGWFETGNNPSARTRWELIPDNSGVYEVADTVTLFQRPPLPGQGTTTWWQLRGVKEGHGLAVFKRYFAEELAETAKIAISVVK